MKNVNSNIMNNKPPLTDRLAEIINNGLPGKAAQYKMAPKLRIEELEKLNSDSSKARSSAVMIMIHIDDDKKMISIIQRPKYEGVHGGQAAFPGGQAEKSDKTLWHTACRETFEEIGVPENELMEVGAMTPLYIPPSNFMVYPYIGYFEGKPKYTADKREVEKIYDIDFNDITSDQNKRLIDIKTSYATFRDVPIYKINGIVIWGATAMILSEFEDIIKAL